MSGKDRDSVLGELVGLLPLAGKMVRRRVREWVDESRVSLRETVREVRREIERELEDAPAVEEDSFSPEEGSVPPPATDSASPPEDDPVTDSASPPVESTAPARPAGSSDSPAAEDPTKKKDPSD